MTKIQTKQQQPTSRTKAPKAAPSTFSEHINELRRRLMWVGLVFALGSLLAYAYHEPLLKIIMQPLHGEKLVYLTPGGGFSFIFQVSIYAGMIAAAPILMYHVHAFIKPALPARAQRSAIKIVCIATILMILGIIYGYFVAIPAALTFLTTFAGDAVTPNLTADSYLGFFLAYMGGLALFSLLPLLLMFWHWIHPLTPSGLLKSERWVILLAFIAAAIITPTPDAFNQAMIAGPIIALYQFGVFAVLIAIRRHKKLMRKQPAAEVIPPQPQVQPQATLTPQPVVYRRPAQPLRRRPIRAMDIKPTRARFVAPAPPPRTRLSIDGMVAR